jgi:coenzyme PQQ synthesis protein D (PqqD)
LRRETTTMATTAATIYRRNQSIRVREMEAWDAALVYTPPPETPAMHWLNTQAWLVLELCDGRTREESIDAFREAVPARADRAEEIVRDCLETLEQKGIVHRDET